MDSWPIIIVVFIVLRRVHFRVSPVYVCVCMCEKNK